MLLLPKTQAYVVLQGKRNTFSGCELRIVIWKVMAGVAIVPENQIFHFRDMYMYDQH